jgi:hypothetical protein
MQIGMSEFLEKVAKLKKKEEKVEALKFNDSFALRTTLQAVFDPRLKFALPEGVPPYKANDLTDQEGVYLRECRKLIYFIEAAYPTMKSIKREQIFIELLENVAPADAKLLISIKDKKLPFKGIDETIVREAFPGLIPDEQTTDQKVS